MPVVIGVRDCARAARCKVRIRPTQKRLGDDERHRWVARDGHTKIDLWIGLGIHVEREPKYIRTDGAGNVVSLVIIQRDDSEAVAVVCPIDNSKEAWRALAHSRSVNTADK